MDELLATWIVEAIKIVKKGVCDKLEKDNILVYRCGTIIRIDCKKMFEE